MKTLVEAVLAGRIGPKPPRHKLDSRLLIYFDAVHSVLQFVFGTTLEAAGIMLQEYRMESWLPTASLIGFRRDAVTQRFSRDSL